MSCKTKNFISRQKSTIVLATNCGQYCYGSVFTVAQYTCSFSSFQFLFHYLIASSGYSSSRKLSYNDWKRAWHAVRPVDADGD